MPLKIKLKKGEEFYVNGSHMISESGGEFIVKTPNSQVLVSKDFMTKEEVHLSAGHALAYLWFLHLTGQQKMTEEQCAGLAMLCVHEFPKLKPIAKEKRWYSLYKVMRKLLEK